MRVLLEEVVFDLPQLVEAALIRGHHLVDSLAVDAVLRFVIPRLEDRVLVENAELHPALPLAAAAPWPGRSDIGRAGKGCQLLSLRLTIRVRIPDSRRWTWAASSSSPIRR